MKKQLLALSLSGLLLLSGCTSMLERSHVSSVPHVDYSVTEDASILRVETYQGLVNSILYFVNERADSGTIRLYNYTGDVEADLSNACSELLQKDPLCAYSVRAVNYDTTRILTYYEVALSFDYSRTPEEVAAIRDVVGLTGLRQMLSQLMRDQPDSLALLTTYFSGGKDLVRQLVQLAYYAQPDLYVDPEVPFSYTVSFYPENGTRRIIELRADGRTPGHHATAEEQADYARRLEAAAALLLEADPPAGTTYTVEEVANILRSASGGYDPNGTSFALNTLSGEPACHLGYLLAMEYLCQRCGMEVFPVVNQGPGYNFSLIVSTEDGYRHLLPQALFPVLTEDGQLSTEPQPLPLYTDLEMKARGYIWTQTLYPTCESSEPPLSPEPTAAPDGSEKEN